MQRVLIIGGGGREHAIAWKLHQEGHEIHAAPGNPGMALFARCVALDAKNHLSVVRYVKDNAIDFVVVGPEAPLGDGIVDTFNGLNLAIFGPTKAASRIETSKYWCCGLLEDARVSIPFTSYFASFASMREEVQGTHGRIVIKKSGLAAGKGAEVIRMASDLPGALARLERLEDDQYLVQEMEEGPELSFFVLTDGDDFLFGGSAQDYKPLHSGGPNTGGMGGFSPHPILTAELKTQIEETIVRPTIKALANCGCPYKGVMYFQLMITKRGPVVIEINCRFGDPETQLLMPLLDCELLPLLQATTKFGFLRMFEAKFKPEVAVGIVMASEGYPDKPITGRAIIGLDLGPEHVGPNDYAHVFHAGTKLVDGQVVTSGGRVLTVVGTAPDYYTAKNVAMKAVSLIKFEGEYHREDIADEVIATETRG
ncbi:MAG: phosphoribosylamine--glycine ligase [Candidatus Doudnabacteria bacterium]|nr:phosphoribosylamine--glycine ligase [Candidatus Doudnabacteria bacterium]